MSYGIAHHRYSRLTPIFLIVALTVAITYAIPGGGVEAGYVKKATKDPVISYEWDGENLKIRSEMHPRELMKKDVVTDIYLREADKYGIKVSKEEVEREMARILKDVNMDLGSYLEESHMGESEFRALVERNLRIQKLLMLKRRVHTLGGERRAPSTGDQVVYKDDNQELVLE